MDYIAPFLTGFGVTLLAVPLVRVVARKIGAMDHPDFRKVHRKPIPRIGGVAIALGVLAAIVVFLAIDRRLAGLLGGFLVLLALGLWDDIKQLSPYKKLLFQILAAVIVLAGGIGIVTITNPFGGIIDLSTWIIPVTIGGLSFNVIPYANLVTILWIVGMINTINFLDGLDGLATGVSAIASLSLFVLATGQIAQDPVVAVISIALLGSLLGFLPYNFFPSTIFLGDSGSYTIGLVLAILPIYVETKFIIGSIVLAIAILDALWVVMRRIARKQSPFHPDRGHMHHVLLDVGIPHRRVVLIIYLMSLIIAASLLILGEQAAFIALVLLLIGLVFFLRILRFQREK